MIQSLGYSKPATPKAAALLLLTRKFTERDAQFLRDHFGILPPAKKIRDARWKLLQTMPLILVHIFSTGQWKKLPAGRFNSSSIKGKDKNALE